MRQGEVEQLILLDNDEDGVIGVVQIWSSLTFAGAADLAAGAAFLTGAAGDAAELDLGLAPKLTYRQNWPD